MPASLRMPGESDDAFRDRAERAARIAKVLIEACLNNHCMRQYIDDPALPHSVAGVHQSPAARIEYEQAIAIGGIGECFAATKNKHWGAGPWVMPLEPDDVFYPGRITYIYRENSLYNRRFEQRRRLKELLGKQHRRLVEAAKRRTQREFLADLDASEADAIGRILDVSAVRFWRACRGRQFLALPPRMVQLELDFGQDDHIPSSW